MPDYLDLARLQEICDAATPGPWDESGCRSILRFFSKHYGDYPDIADGNRIPADNAAPDAKLLVTARTALPALLERVRDLEKELNLTYSINVAQGPCPGGCGRPTPKAGWCTTCFNVKQARELKAAHENRDYWEAIAHDFGRQLKVARERIAELRRGR